MQKAAPSCKSLPSVDSSFYIGTGFQSYINLTQVLLHLLNYLWLMLAIFIAVLVLARMELILFTVAPVVVRDLSSFPCSAMWARGWEGWDHSQES